MLKSKPGSTARLLELCAGYFLSYVITGVLVKFFTGNLNGTPRMSDMAFLVNNTIGGNLLCLVAVLALGWIPWPARHGGRWPREMPYILASGVCTAIIIPGTTLLYTLPISVMVAMVIMRGSIIVISRAIDAVQIRQGILRRKVYPQENWAVVFALVAVGANLLPVPMAPWFEAHPDVAHALGIVPAKLKGGFDFVHNSLAMWTLGAYITAYAIRLYLMNYFKNTRKGPADVDNTGYFALEQMGASAVIFGAMGVIWFGVQSWGWADARLAMTHDAVAAPDLLAIASGMPYGLVAFFSVFLFMFQGRTATFAGLVNRITSLLAGTAATLILAWFWRQKPPAVTEWVSFFFILVAVGFLSRAEQKRAPAPAAAWAGGGRRGARRPCRAPRRRASCRREDCMKTLIARSRFLSLVAVFALLVTYALALFWGVMKSVAVWTEIVTSGGKSPGITLALIQLVDAFLIATVLFVLATSIYKLFVGDPAMPGRLVARNLPELKSKLSGIIVLVLAVRFAEVMFEGSLTALELLWFGLATAVVAGALIAFSWFSHEDEKEET